MPSIIDSFVIELGLDPSKFNQGQRDAMENFRRSVQNFRSQADDAERAGVQVQDVLSKATRTVLTLGLTLMGASGIKNFVEQQVKLGVEVGRSSLLMGTSAEMLSKWEGVARRSGGTAEGMRGSLGGLVQQFQQFAVTGESSVIPYFRQLKIDIADASGHMRGLDDIMLDMADRFSKMDPAKAAFFGHALGFDDATIALLIKGRDAVKQLLDEQSRIAVISKQQTDAAAEMWKSWDTLVQKMQDAGRKILYDPAISAVLDMMSGDTEALKKHRAQATAEANLSAPGSKYTGMHSGFGTTEVPRDSVLGWLIYGGALNRSTQGSSGSAPSGGGGRQTRGDRNHNPGNIEYGPFALKHGATGSDGRFAIFPSQEAGERAMEALLKGNYGGMTLSQIQRKWVGNEDAGYLGSMMNSTVLGANNVPNLNDPGVLHALAAGMARGEGSHYSTTIHVDNMTVHSQAQDAGGIASDIRGELTKRSLSQQSNAGPG